MCTLGVLSHDSPRAQTCTLKGPGLQKHQQNSMRRPPEREKKSENGELERGKKARNFWGSGGGRGQAEGGPGRGVGRGSGAGGVQWRK